MRKAYIILNLVVLCFLIVLGGSRSLAAPISSQRCYGFVDAHQGQAENDWALPGTTNFFDNRGELVQVGSINWNGPAASSGRVFITYPYSYGGGNTPVLLANVVGPTNIKINVNPSPLFAGAYLDWVATDGSKVASVQLFWVAVGRDPNCSPHEVE